jgi:SAM-dependent methyltransferase
MNFDFASLKAIIRPLVPQSVMTKWRRHRYELEQARFQGRPLDQIFAEIYESHAWDQSGSSAPYRSGPGSQAAVTARYEAFVLSYLTRHPEIHAMVDIGCGDFQVASRILEGLARQQRRIDYIGCDIAANVIAYNTATHARPGIEFRVLDVTSEPPPTGDIVTVREVLQHLSNAHIAVALENLSRCFKTAIITESVHTDTKVPNIDIISGYRTRDGYRSGVYVDKPPFGLRVLEEDLTPVTPTHQLRTTVVALR